MPSRRQPPPRSLDDLLRRHVIVCTGSGGVGKTTTSAALALRAADAGQRAIVCTIDPARRLAQSLGLDELDNSPRQVPDSAFGGDPPRGELWAMMLDMKTTFDDMILDLTTPERARAIFENPFYKHVSSTLAGTQEYMAMEKLWELHEEGRWELIVIDTPPTRSALDFLDAPRRLTDFLEGRLLKLLLWPTIAAGRGYLRALSFGTQVMLKTVTRVTGSELFADVASFFAAFEGMYGSFKARAERVKELLVAPRTAFVVVATPHEAMLREARYFAERLAEEHAPLGAVIVNRAHSVPSAPGLEDPLATEARTSDPALAWALRTYASWRELSLREDSLVCSVLGDIGRAPLWRVPDFAEEVHDIPALRRVAEALAGS
ncbi:MAG: ArsA family ATPase [Acidobacteria bacterium]|nr:ArsA family ATPase [Acidobacteriota bacterium]